MTVLYRYSNNSSDSYNPDHYIRTAHESVHVYVHEFKVIKETKCGAWIVCGYSKNKKFVNNTCIKQYAYRTIEEARENFISRKKCQIDILNAQIRAAKWSMDAVEQNKPMQQTNFFFT